MNSRRPSLLVLVFGLGACNAILGIGDHELEPVVTSPPDGSVDVSRMDARGMDVTNRADAASEGGDATDGAKDGGTISKLPPPFASCKPGGPGMSDCGQSHDDDCCASPIVNGDMYERTYEVADGGSLVSATDPATVSSFLLDKYEVTVGRYRQYRTAWSSGFTPPPGSGKHTHLNGGKGLTQTRAPGFEPGWNAADDGKVAPTDANLDCEARFATWTASVGSNEELPINCVTRLEAYAFCVWDGGFLPSEAEWEYAAAGGALQREYPWGSTAPGTVSQYANFDCHYPSGKGGKCTGIKNIEPVGMDPMGLGFWGQLDLAGNAFEWVLDYYAPYAIPCNDCADLTASLAILARGGSYYFVESAMLPPNRQEFGPDERDGAVGVRCARAP